MAKHYIGVKEATGQIVLRCRGTEEVLRECTFPDHPDLVFLEMEASVEYTHYKDGELVCEEPVCSEATYLFSIQVKRNKLLTESDWTQVPDSPLSPEKKEEWRIYRQALRDFPDTCEDPANPEWPTPPI